MSLLRVADGEDGLQYWNIFANMFKKQWRAGDKK
jgi:hypothetical protein